MGITDTGLLTFLRDPNRVEKRIVKLYYYDPATGVDNNVLWFSTHGKTQNPDDGSTFCRQGLRSITPYSINALSASDLLGVIQDPIRSGQQGTIRIEGFDGSCDDLLARGWVFDGHDFVEYIGGTYSTYGSGISEYTPRPIRGGVIIGNPLVDFNGATFQISDYGQKFEAPVQRKRFSGSDHSIRLRTGTADYITFGTPAALDLTGNITIAAKLRMKSNAATFGILSWRLTTTTTYPYAFGIDSTNHLFFAATGVTTVATSATLSSEVPYVVSCVVQGSILDFHIMNLLTGTTVTETFTLSATTRSAHVGGNLRIGHHNGVNPTDAIFDWVYLWGIKQPLEYIQEIRYRQLSALEIADPSCKFCAKMEEGSGTTTADSSTTAATGTFSGTPTWTLTLEGGSSLEGTLKPDVWGAVPRHPLVLVWPLTRIYMACGDKISQFRGVSEGGASLTSGTDYTDQETFLAATTAASTYDTCNTTLGAFVRLGSNATLPLSCNVRGCLAADGSTYVNTCDGIVKAVAELRAGLSAAQVASFSTGVTSILGISVNEDMTCRDLIAQCLSSVGAIAWFSRTGTDEVTLFKGKALSTFRDSGTVFGNLDFNSVSVEPLATEAPPRLIKVNYSPNYVPLSSEEISTSVVSLASQLALEQEYLSLIEYIQTKRVVQSEVTLDSILTVQADAREALKRIALIHRLSPRLIKVVAPAEAIKYDVADFVGLCLADINVSTGKPYPRLEIGHGGGTTRHSGFRAFNFTNSGYIDLGTSASFNLSTFTIQVTFRATSGTSGFRCLTSRESSSSNRNWWLGLWDSSVAGYNSGALTFLTTSGGTSSYSLGTFHDLRDGDWHTATIVANAATSMIYLYLDGVLVASRGCPTISTPASQNVYIGCEIGPIRYWDGQIREWTLWNTARTANQIYADRHGVLSPSSAQSSFLFEKIGPTDSGSIGATLTVAGGTAPSVAEYLHPFDTWRVVGIDDDNDPENGTGAVKMTLWRRN